TLLRLTHASSPRETEPVNRNLPKVPFPLTHYNLLDLNAAAVCSAARKQRAALKSPSLNVEAFLETLARQHLPETVVRLRAFAELI
uniref:hypothetical protein n=1 Tax=Candidatus Laterigemmans baculatus TaxID=2770505 RepID=UPI00193F43A8